MWLPSAHGNVKMTYIAKFPQIVSSSIYFTAKWSIVDFIFLHSLLEGNTWYSIVFILYVVCQGGDAPIVQMNNTKSIPST